ncbi:glycosyltransferase family 2 protein [Clostridium oryzae]|uniref:Putative glycosyltransferase EpsJ n=1 Tax=Clostridium oryzae TaxID=1450648 RepID=A0A1V4IZ12_9CLOT|nr:glycosyltransferase family 2 protein [Clostridium oryzae]OPJ65060.1 putative glycosyltransferase EpsJ [Clostridium oryzae]
MAISVSVVIPNYNGEVYIEECLKSLTKQSCKDFETVVIDNASIDKSMDIIRKYQQELSMNLIINDKNLGFSGAVNQGIQAAKGKYIFLLNNDTICEDKVIEELITTAQRQKKLFSVSSKMIRYKEPEKIDDAGDLYTIVGWAIKRGDGKTVNSFTDERNIFSACGGASLYVTEVLREIGGFDTQFFAYLEDMDLGYRAKVQGYKNVYCPKALVYHIGSATSGSRHNAFKVALAARNNIYVIYKNMPLLQILINLPFIIAGALVKIIYFLPKGLSKEYLKGLFQAFTGLRKIKKTKFKLKNLINYVRIELELIGNTVKMFFV